MQLSIRPLLATAAVGLALAVTPGFAQGQEKQHADKSASMQNISAADYVRKAAVGDLFEIQSSQLALEQSTSEEIQDFARQMVEDHTEATQMLQQAVADSGEQIQIPTSLDSKHQDMLQKLNDAQGSSFDQLYLQMQQKAHEEALKLHRSYAENGDVSELQDAAEQIASVVEGHYEEVKEISPTSES